jgi:hypothetical protein
MKTILPGKFSDLEDTSLGAVSVALRALLVGSRTAEECEIWATTNMPRLPAESVETLHLGLTILFAGGYIEMTSSGEIVGKFDA